MAPTKSKKKKPSPDELLAEIRGRAPAKTYEFEDYMEVIHEMQAKKNFSYANIADFLAERLGYSISRGQVYRAYQLWLELKARDEEEQAEAERLAPPDEDIDFDPEENEVAKQARLLDQAVADLLKYSLDKYPDGSLPASRAELFKRVLAFLDEKTRDDFEAEQADKRLEELKGKVSS